MSMLPAAVHSHLTQILQALQSSDNHVRGQAEEQLNQAWVDAQPDVLLMGLVEQIEGATEPSIRSFAAVLFRRVAGRLRKDTTTQESNPLFYALPQPQQIAIRQKLLPCLTSESLPHVRNKVGDAVAEIGRQYTDEGEQWPELLGTLFQTSQSRDASQRECAFRIFAMLPGIIKKQHEDTVSLAFTKGFKDDDVSVRIAAMEAFASFFRAVGKRGQPKYYLLVTEILNILPPLKDAQDSEQLSKALMALIELAEIAPKMFRPLFSNLVTFSTSVIQDKELEDQTRQNALELMMIFADRAPQMCKKDPSYTSEMVTQCLSLMTDIGMDDDDAAEWNASEDLDEKQNEENHIAGEQSMDRLANRLGGQAILPPTFSWLPRMITSSSWRDRHAALMAISAISEGCRELMEGELDKVLDLVVPTLRDPHPRVRWAGCNALGQMSTDFAVTMQTKYHQVVLTNILPVLESAQPRVQSHAAAALVNFCEEAEKDILEPYLDDLLHRLLALLRSPKRFVQEQALSTIATIADSAEAAFARYYDTLMPLLFSVVREESSKEYRLLRAKAMECMTLIALAVGTHKLGQDALSLVQLLASVQQNITDADDPQASYLMHCWARMARVLRGDFVAYLAGVMPPLMELASAKADIQLLDDAEQASEFERGEGWELLPIKGKVVGIRTATLDDKHMAIELILIYAQVLEAAFEPYVVEMMDNVVLPSLSFFFHDPVRVTAAKCVPQLLNAYKKAHGGSSPPMLALWGRTIDKLLEVLGTEPAVETLSEMYQCLYESVEVMGKDRLTGNDMAAFVEASKSTLSDYQTRAKRRLEEYNEPDDGDELSFDAQFAIDEDQTLLSDMNKAFHTIFKHQGATFLQYWQRLLPFCDAFVTSGEATQRQWSLCVLDDVLEFCGEQSWAYSDHIMQPLVQGMRDDSPGNRQAACYGVGVAAHKGGPAWAEFVAASIPSLFHVTQRPDARMEDHVFATENACASIARILLFNASKIPEVDRDRIVEHWLETLPIVNDTEVAVYAYTFLGRLIEQQNRNVMANPVKMFGHIVRALQAETLAGQAVGRAVSAGKLLLHSTGIDLGLIISSAPSSSSAAAAASSAINHPHSQGQIQSQADGDLVTQEGIRAYFN